MKMLKKKPKAPEPTIWGNKIKRIRETLISSSQRTTPITKKGQK